MRSAVVLIWAVAACLACNGEPRSQEKIADTLQGRWVLEATGPQGQSARVEKHFEGNRETYTVSRDGQPAYAHVVTGFRIMPINEAEGLYAYSCDGFEITLGPQKGMKIEQVIEYLFKLKGDQFIEMGGVLQNDPREPSLQVYKKGR